MVLVEEAVGTWVVDLYFIFVVFFGAVLLVNLVVAVLYVQFEEESARDAKAKLHGDLSRKNKVPRKCGREGSECCSARIPLQSISPDETPLSGSRQGLE